MTTNPFDDENSKFYALVNSERQYSLWPNIRAIPEGWQIAHGAPEGTSRKNCIEFIEANWTDMRPKSLQALDGGGKELE
ncbi:MbtH family protein [Mycobacteroides abscessus]|uniref:MbtH family protein n=1 Tax=Mycobacteroides abscessus TaxID=36809 RepID=UPI0009A721F6|nr:MbtH family NRPS accessory protein [Mycobacteroides abscessus]MDO3110503.1 MbtH family NRPS accessory protein [Mycobacteroides abscessus subsp. abscessus]SLE10968.1 Putative MbtH family protein [Mycobacteroides abscessus subsp. bolletii]